MSKKNDLEHTSTMLGNQDMKGSQRMVSVVEPYELPEGWKWCRLGEVCKFENGYAFKSDKFAKEGIPVVRITNLKDNEVSLEDCVYTTEDNIEERFIVKKGDLLIAMSGATTGKNGVYLFDKIVYLNQRVGNIKVIDSTILNDKYRNFYIQAKEQDILKNAYGGAQPNISSTKICAMPFPLPPTLAEQQRIVNRIESMFAKLDEAKEKAQNIVDGFETRKAAILHKAFTGELTARWRKENCVCDDSWEEKRFDSCIAKMQNGLSKRSGNEGEETVVLRLANMGEDDFDVSDLRTIKLTSKEKNNYSLAKNDVVMIRVNGSKTNVGRQLLVKNNKGWSFCDHIIRIQFEVFCLPNYMVYFSKTKEYIDYVQDNMVSSAGQNTISRKGLSNLSLKVPTLPEQVEIVRILDIIIEKENKAKQAAEAVLEQIDLLKKSILARAFRGEL